jgi:hypothetical protein
MSFRWVDRGDEGRRRVPESWDEECRKAEAVELQGDFQNYAPQDYEDDMKMALVAGISAFAMNEGHDTTDSGQYRTQPHSHDSDSSSG